MRSAWIAGTAGWLVFAAALVAGQGNAEPAQGRVEAKRWMSGLANGFSLGRLSIPGTHDSAALHEPWPGTAACQDAEIGKQLEFGVRFLDIRCRHLDDRFEIYHGAVSQKKSFDDVLRDVCGFLAANPGECVIMEIKEEAEPKGNTRSFEKTFDAYVAKNSKTWWLGDKVPKLGAVRGRIVLVRRFASKAKKGIDATHWPDNARFRCGCLFVQDCYIVKDPNAKWTLVETALAAAFADENSGHLHLNFASGYRSGNFGIPDVPAVSKPINAKLRTYFANAPRGAYGCVIMDHADAALARLVFKSNFMLYKGIRKK